jgi:hypothetical protein
MSCAGTHFRQLGEHTSGARGVSAAILRTRFGLFETYVVWLLLLLVMVWPCIWYYQVKRNRPNLVTRYF